MAIHQQVRLNMLRSRPGSVCCCKPPASRCSSPSRPLTTALTRRNARLITANTQVSAGFGFEKSRDSPSRTNSAGF
jgi:hypothetical protein